ncbi:LuxR C-terminal-related transcriptional regulator [Micromonospora echinaurantiaca]|uniref:LuxR C-terminal-related transcriptional regulator n=1 Tax=Micromonospora echinaurantiaca TaxID=47857 RepID=UPI0037ADBD66
MVAGAMEAGRLEIAEALPRLASDSLEAARARIFLAIPLGDARPAAEHLRWLYEAPAVAPSIAPHERLRLFLERAFALLMLGEEAGWTEVRQIPDDTASPREAALLAIGQTNVAEAAMRWGRYEEARARLAKALALADNHQFLGHLGSIATTRAHLDWFTGAWDGLAGRATALLGDDDGVRLKDRCEAALVAGLMQLAGGERAAAEERLRFAGRDDQQRIEAAAALAQLHLRDGDVDEALRITDEPAEITIRSGVWPRATEVAPVRVAALVAAGQLGSAADLVTAFARAVGDKDAPAPQASLVGCRAILADADGQPARAAALFAQVSAAWQAMPRPYDALLAREHQARSLITAGWRDSGLALLSEVARALAELGAHNDADRVARFLHGHGLGAPVARGRGRPSYGNQLSPRELEVARLLVGGRTNRQIADALVVSTQTVASQLKSAMRKLRVTSRTALAIRVVELGLVGEQGRPPVGDE